MPPNIERYSVPHTLVQLWYEISTCQTPPIFLAGSTSLLREYSQDYSSPPRVWIDICRIPELGGIHELDESIRIGATTTCTEVAQHPLVQEYAQALSQATQQFSTWPIRNRCTLGGLASRGGSDVDILPALFVLDAQILCSNGTVERRLDCEDFYLQPHACALQPGEIILGIEIPKTQRNSLYLKRDSASPNSPAKVSVAFSMALEQQHFAQVRIAVGGASSLTHRITTAEGLLEGQPTDYLPLLERVVVEIRRDARPTSDHISSSRYRKWSVGMLARQGLRMWLLSQQPYTPIPTSVSGELTTYPPKP